MLSSIFWVNILFHFRCLPEKVISTCSLTIVPICRTLFECVIVSGQLLTLDEIFPWPGDCLGNSNEKRRLRKTLNSIKRCFLSFALLWTRVIIRKIPSYSCLRYWRYSRWSIRILSMRLCFTAAPKLLVSPSLYLQENFIYLHL